LYSKAAITLLKSFKVYHPSVFFSKQQLPGVSRCLMKVPLTASFSKLLMRLSYFSIYPLVFVLKYYQESYGLVWSYAQAHYYLRHAGSIRTKKALAWKPYPMGTPCPPDWPEDIWAWAEYHYCATTYNNVLRGAVHFDLCLIWFYTLQNSCYLLERFLFGYQCYSALSFENAKPYLFSRMGISSLMWQLVKCIRYSSQSLPAPFISASLPTYTANKLSLRYCSPFSDSLIKLSIISPTKRCPWIFIVVEALLLAVI
jgi:hypothetical protein